MAADAIQVTEDHSGAPITNLHGRILFDRPIRLLTFDTTFVLRISPRPLPESIPGEGLAFVLTGDPNMPDDSSGQWLGIVNSNTNGSAQIVAVEFDTRKSYPEDLDDNHVGIDLGSVYSVQQVSLSGIDINLASDTDITVRIQYDGDNLTVLFEESSSPVITRPIDLSLYLPEEVYVGFTGSTSEYTQLNCIRSWEFIGSEIPEGKKIWVWIVVSVVSVIVILIFVSGLVCWKMRYGDDKFDFDPYPTIEEAIQGSSTAPRKFKLKELRKATGNFNSKNKLGKGGFGTVYKGIIENKEIAVKKVSKKTTQGKQEFISEVITIGNLHHRNLVKLIGWAYERKEYLLVYEYMPNGSLDHFVFHGDKLETGNNNGPSSNLMSWGVRLRVISGAAQALEYLHNGCEKKVLHRDIKSSNIMLDSEFNAKLGDFGLARTYVQSDQTHHSTKEVAGTPGYMAPEVFLTGRATEETDVYAFGILLLEVACGRKPGGWMDQDDYGSNIVKWVWELYRTENLMNAADARLNGDFNAEEMACVLILGLACCHPNPNNRPSMKFVLKVMAGEAEAPELPLERPAFVWPPLPPSFKDKIYKGSQVTLFTELSGR
uniref:non-specific serine/threonine protein kinase n=1 Tax=Linum usitatissimum TaxID=4006 RepID=I6Y9I0_LINUS|nr:putative ATP-binding protein [Linum usitatissimum]